MRELADVDVFEVDHPASQQDKRERLVACRRRPPARCGSCRSTWPTIGSPMR
jgi:O-methyltransferase involved in polyketide biosynthesis